MNFSDQGRSPSFLIHDRDTSSPGAFDEVFRGEGRIVVASIQGTVALAEARARWTDNLGRVIRSRGKVGEGVGKSSGRHVDETYIKVSGTWRYVFRAIDQFGQVVDVFLSLRRDTKAARRFFAQAIGRTRISPVEVTTDRYRVSPRVLDELLPAAFHDTEAHANNPLETDHGRLKARLRPMRGLKRHRTAPVIVAGHAFVQNLRRGFYDLGTDVPPAARVADAFSDLALVI